MFELTPDYIRDYIADSKLIYQKGVQIFQHGAFFCTDANFEHGRFIYDVDGNYGDYTTEISIFENNLECFCDCPYPEKGCKHTVAALLDVYDRIHNWQSKQKAATAGGIPKVEDKFLTGDEIRAHAIEDRHKRAGSEDLIPVFGDMMKGEHIVETLKGKQYTVTLHDPESCLGHCSCPDFLTNRLNICKHMIFVSNSLKKKKNYKSQLKIERFPFVDIYWDSEKESPVLFHERPDSEMESLHPVLSEYFNKDGDYSKGDLSELMKCLSRLSGNKRVRVQESVYQKLDSFLLERQLEELSEAGVPPLNKFDVQLYPYQLKGVEFGLYKKAVLIGDEMGLGKTLQAIVLAVLKNDIFGYDKVLIVTMASLKEQWKREIERFTSEKGLVIAGPKSKREELYQDAQHLFKITNYEAVLRDTTILSRFKPDLVILDEAQRIKNFNTKTADAVKSVPRKHAIVLTGTPLENKLEDVYSIVQFLDPDLLSPLWKFAADHFMLSRDKKGKILGYRNLDRLQEKLKPVVIRRKKKDVLSDLPDEIVNTYYLEMTEKQQKIHAGYVQSLLPLINKKFLTPMDLRKIQELLLCMRMVCNSTYLIDRKTNISPKLKELEVVLSELVIDNDRKVVIFSEWTTMNFLIAKQLSSAGIRFVELSGKIPVKKRQLLIDEFTNNPDCKVFLSTDAGGTGLNLQASDCVINFELPWNPAKMHQRIGRVSRIGQQSGCINVVNLVMKNSIEEKILAGIQLKTDLFKGVFDEGPDMVEFSREKRAEMLNRLREMMGETPEQSVSETRRADEIPEDTPNYLNPEVLGRDDSQLAYDSEENAVEEDPGAAATSQNQSETGGDHDKGGDIISEKSPEQVEKVLNSGMAFLGGLFEMATGKKMETADDDSRMIQIDRDTGEVTMKFRLPGLF